MEYISSILRVNCRGRRFSRNDGNRLLYGVVITKDVNLVLIWMLCLLPSGIWRCVV